MKFVEAKPGLIINIDMITIVDFFEKSRCNEAYANIYFINSKDSVTISADEYEKLKIILGKENENGCS